MHEPQLPNDFQAVDHVPVWGASVGVMTLAFTAVWLGFRDRIPGSGSLLVLFLILASLGATLGMCGVVLALRDGRRMGVALLGLAGSLSLPLILLFAGAPR